MDHLFVHILIFSLLIQTVQASQVRCADGYYMDDGCQKCNDNCLECVSKMNCTRCIDGYYDTSCDKPCKEKCPSSCHKVNGFCMYGCPDGKYSTSNGLACRNCTENCKICESPSACLRCTDGKYGESCQHPCPVQHCMQCEKSNGECLQCKVSFFLVDGQCKSCPYGCRRCNTSNNCLSCEDEFFGPSNGYCLFKCPSNDVYIDTVYDMTDRCRIVQDTDINTCDGYSDRYTCATSGYCLQNTVCSKSVKCVTDSTEQTSCAIDMQYTCDHECKKVYNFLVCNTACSVRKKDSGNDISFCLGDDILSRIVEPFKKIYKGICHRPKVNLETERCPNGYIIDDVCHKCPDNCLECVSDINCTLCMDGFYGSICEIPCKENCTRSCHKMNGYCLYKSSTLNGPRCRNCTDGKYSESCKVEHCIRCEQSKSKCLQCKDTFFLVDGQCKRCLYGCQLCNTANNCLSCIEEFFGPTNGSCLFKCPANDTSVYTNYGKNDQCRNVQDTDINTCEVYSNNYTCSTSGYCLQNTTCLNSVKCVVDSTEQTSCAIDMQYNCYHKCQKVYTFLVCNTTCSVRKKDSGNHIPFCLGDDSLSRIYELFKKVSKLGCSQTKDRIEKTQVNYIILAFAITIAAIIIDRIRIAMYRYRKRHSASLIIDESLDGDNNGALNYSLIEGTPLIWKNHHCIGELGQHVTESGNPVPQCDTNAYPHGGKNWALNDIPSEETPLNPKNNHCIGELYQQVSESGHPVSKCDTNASPDGDEMGALNDIPSEETPLNPENNHCMYCIGCLNIKSLSQDIQCHNVTNAPPDGDNYGALTEETPLNQETSTALIYVILKIYENTLNSNVKKP